jgi:hypothetical protein
VVPRRASAVDPGIKPSGGLFDLMAQELPHELEAARDGIKGDLCAQVPELVRGEFDASTPFCISGNRPGDGGSALWGPIRVDKQPRGRCPITFGAIRSRYSISIRTNVRGMS